MSTQHDENPEIFANSRFWIFLNSNFGLFILSSVGLSFLTWMYTEVSQSMEQRIINAETATMLQTEISYRVTLLDNYFRSDCVEGVAVNRKTFVDIRDIYKASTDFQAIFTENNGKDLHTLIWERAALLEAGEKGRFEKSFNELTIDFNAYLIRFLRATDKNSEFHEDGDDIEEGAVPAFEFYGNQVDNDRYRVEAIVLQERFRNAVHPIFPKLVTQPLTQRIGDSERADQRL